MGRQTGGRHHATRHYHNMDHKHSSAPLAGTGHQWNLSTHKHKHTCMHAHEHRHTHTLQQKNPTHTRTVTPTVTPTEKSHPQSSQTLTFFALSYDSSLASASHSSTCVGQHSTARLSSTRASSSDASSTAAFHNLQQQQGFGGFKGLGEEGEGSGFSEGLGSKRKQAMYSSTQTVCQTITRAPHPLPPSLPLGII